MLNIIYPIYNPKPHVLETHLNNWRDYSIELRKQIKIILIDDCSTPPIKFNPSFELNYTVARIKEDIYWNVCGAQNLGHFIADDDWCFSSDIDHILLKEDCQRILDLPKKINSVYWFRRYKLGKPWKPHSNSFLIHKKDYLNIGGYDEDLAGNGGYNDEIIILKMQYFGLNLMNTNIPIYLDENLSFTFKGFIKKGIGLNSAKYYRKKRYMKEGKYVPFKPLNFNWEIINEYNFSGI